MYNNTNNRLKLKNINNCIIADYYINDIVQDFTVSGSNQIKDWWNTDHSIVYVDGAESSIIKSHNNSSLLASQFFNDPIFSSIWTPIFISANTQEQRISDRGIYNKSTLGTNEYISFEPRFKNNTIDASNARLVIPWKLNNDNFFYDCTKGILCWTKSLTNDISGSTPEQSREELLWSKIPYYVPFYSTKTNEGPYVKIDEDRILINDDFIDENLSSYHKPVDFNIKTPVDLFGKDYDKDKYTLNKYGFVDQTNNYIFDKKSYNELLWIPDGDVYSYVENTGGVNSEEKSYISASLYKYYTAIYHSLTIRRERKFTRDLSESRRYKNLAKYLATSPFITKSAISMMIRDPIQDQVSSYISQSINLQDALLNISAILNNEDSVNDFDLEQNQLKNIIRTPTELINKLRNKYGIKLSINNGSIRYTGELAHRDDVAISNVYNIYTKNADHYISEDSYISLCQKIKVNNYSIESKINGDSKYDGTDKSYRSIEIYSKLDDGGIARTNRMPLFDGVEPRWDSALQLNIVMQYTDNKYAMGKTLKEFDVNNTVFEYNKEYNNSIEPSEDWLLPKAIDPVLPQGYVIFKVLSEAGAIYDYDNPYFSMSEEAKKQFVILWEPVSGPPIKFTDSNLSETGIYDTSSSNIVKVVFSDYARYTIKCTVLTPYGNFVKYKTFFVVKNGNGGFVFNQYNVDDIGNYNKKEVIYTENPEILNTYNENRENYGGPILSEKFQQTIPITPNRYNSKFVKCSGFKKIAINARGLVWFIDTLFKVGRNGYLEAYIEKLSGPIYKAMCSEPANVPESYGKLSKPFDIYNEETTRSQSLTLEYELSSSDSTAVVYVDKIVLENTRDGSDECSKCISTYGSDMVGVTAFGGSIGQKTLSIDRINNGYNLLDFEQNDTTSIVNYSFPNYSLDYSPKLYKYGRYGSNDFVEALTGTTDYTDGLTGLFSQISGSLPSENLYDPSNRNSFYTPITGYDLSAKSTNVNKPGEAPGPDVPKYKLCYQKALDIINSGDLNQDFYVEFTKGQFHPQSGWIKDSSTNLSHVLKFNPGARDTFSFNGPAIFGLTSTNLEYNSSSTNLLNASVKPSILPNIYSSSIGIGIGEHIRWDPVCACPPSDDTTESERQQFNLKSPLREIQNQVSKEYVDQLGEFKGIFSLDADPKPVVYRSWHGYRVLGGGNPKLSAPTDTEIIDVNDEFIFNKTNYSKNNNRFDYEFAVTGPSFKPGVVDTGTYNFLGTGGTIPDNISESTISIRDPRVNNFTIQDIEVRLNFLNYVNTQDLIIWLETKPSDEDLRRQRPPGATKFSSPMSLSTDMITGNFFPNLIQYKNPNVAFYDSVPSSELLLDKDYIYNTGVGHYLKNIVDINSNDPGSNFKIYLLNQEYIQNNHYNLSIKFSDHADIGINLNDFGISNKADSVAHNPNFSNKILEDSDSIIPTLTSMGYSDIDSHIYGNIIKSNKLFPKVNTFSKLKNKSLFLKPPPEEGPCPPEGSAEQQGPSLDSKTVFTLKIALVDEPDLMENFDNIINNGILTDYTPDENILASSIKFNNLCNWEIILHTNESRRFDPKSISNNSYGSSDMLSLIDYNQDPDSIHASGYYGYSFIADMADREFLLPLANMNAPYNYIQDFDICSAAQYDPIKSNLLLGPPIYPTEAAVNILAGSAAAGGIAGQFDLFLNSSAYRDITSYFQESRRWAEADRRLGQIYNITHNDYPMGSAEKILLNISKDGCFWYNVEASIFRLMNTPKLDSCRLEVLPFYKITRKNEELNSKEKLIKLFSEFKYSVIDQISDLIDPIFIKHNLSLTCEEYKKYKDTNTIIKDKETIQLKDYDIFILSVESSDDNDCLNKNGIYILKPMEDNTYTWSSDFADLLCNNNIITINNFLLDYNHAWWKNISPDNHVILKIDSPILSDILEYESEIEVLTEDLRLQNIGITIKIEHSMKILLDNKYCSILVVKTNDDIPNNPDTDRARTFKEFLLDYDIVRPSDRKYGVIINPSWSSANDSNNYPGSQWGYNCNVRPSGISYDSNGLIPQIIFSANSVGSYGSVSPKINKNYLHYCVNHNKIKDLYSVFNNQNNFRLKTDASFLYDGSGEYLRRNNSIATYHYPLDIISNNQKIYNADIITLIENTPNTYSESYNYNQNTRLKNQLYEIIYIKDTSVYSTAEFYYDDPIGSDNENKKIYMEIPGIGSLSHPVELLEDDRQLLIQRVNQLNADIDEDVVNEYAGKIDKSTEFFLTYPSIKTALSYFDSISQLLDSTNNIIEINKIKNNVNSLFEERNSLQSVIDIPSNDKILSPYKYSVFENGDVINKYNVKLSTNYSNYYWINLDPKQSCALSEELRPKVLKATKYSCAFLNPNITSDIVNSINNNICPREVASKAAKGGVEDVNPFDNNNGFGSDFPLGLTYGYYVPKETIESNKKNLEDKHPSIAAWREQSILRTFYMNSTADIVDVASNPDYVIYVTEIYDVALPKEHTIPISESLNTGLFKNDGSADINFVAGWSESCGSSPGGIGLIDSFGERYEGPSRLCNVFNLDDVSSIKVKFRKIPRILRGVDFLGTIFRYSPRSQYRQQNAGKPLQPKETTVGQGSLNNTMYMWQCFELDKNKQLTTTDLPDLMKVMNEMTFRAFYGSADGIEYRDRLLMNNEYGHQLIPFEFFTKPPPPSPIPPTI